MMNKQLGMFCVGLLSGAILMFGFHNALLKRERTFGVLHETIQQVMEARMLNEGNYEQLDQMMERNLNQRAMMAMEARLPSRDRIVGYLAAYYEFTGKEPGPDMKQAIANNSVIFTTETIDRDLEIIKVTLANPNITPEELRKMFDDRNTEEPPSIPTANETAD
ncbi:MAG: hypothetical protein AAF571_06215 [Verrucomicrobiota bacterium]